MENHRTWPSLKCQCQQKGVGVKQHEGLVRRLLDVNEIAGYMGLSAHTIYTWVSQRRIPFTKIGRLTKFDVRAIDEWIAKHSVSPTKPLLLS